jgi:predicted component of type VI protein secretion system
MRLVIEDEAGTRTVVPFTTDEITIGRAPGAGAAWRLPDRNVSRRHARFVRSSGAVHVEDLGSLTGTWLNGERITGRRRLRVGDLVEIGDYDLVVLPDQAEAHGPGTPPPLPLTPVPAAPAQPAVAAPPAAARAARLRLLALAGVVGLLAGLVAGLIVARLRG